MKVAGEYEFGRECCGFDSKNRPITSGDTIQGGRTCSDYLLLLQGLISGGAYEIRVLLPQQQYSKYVKAFYFEYVRTYKALFSPVELNQGCWKVLLYSRSIISAECCEFDKKNRPIASDDIIRRPTCLDCLLLHSSDL